MTLQEALSWLISGPGAGVLSYWIMDKAPFLKELLSEYKRYCSLAIAAAIGMAAFALSVTLQYTPMPADPKAWVEALFAVGFLAAITSQVTHGRRDLRAKDRGSVLRVNG